MDSILAGILGGVEGWGKADAEARRQEAEAARQVNLARLTAAMNETYKIRGEERQDLRDAQKSKAALTLEESKRTPAGVGANNEPIVKDMYGNYFTVDGKAYLGPLYSQSSSTQIERLLEAKRHNKEMEGLARDRNALAGDRSSGRGGKFSEKKITDPYTGKTHWILTDGTRYPPDPKDDPITEVPKAGPNTLPWAQVNDLNQRLDKLMMDNPRGMTEDTASQANRIFAQLGDSRRYVFVPGKKKTDPGKYKLEENAAPAQVLPGGTSTGPSMTTPQTTTPTTPLSTQPLQGAPGATSFEVPRRVFNAPDRVVPNAEQEEPPDPNFSSILSMQNVPGTPEAPANVPGARAFPIEPSEMGKKNRVSVWNDRNSRWATTVNAGEQLGKVAGKAGELFAKTTLSTLQFGKDAAVLAYELLDKSEIKQFERYVMSPQFTKDLLKTNKATGEWILRQFMENQGMDEKVKELNAMNDRAIQAREQAERDRQLLKHLR